MADQPGMTDEQPGRFARIKAGASARWSALKARRPSVRHTVDAWARMKANNANQYAAAITYFSFLALFPLLLLAVAITGFVLQSHPSAQASLFDHITANVPGDVGKTLKSSVQTAIKARTGVGIVGLVGVLLTGLGWIGNLRSAIDAVAGRPPVQRSFLRGRVSNLFVLAGLGLGLLISLGLTVVGTSLTDQILRWLDLTHAVGVHWLIKVAGIALGVVGDMLIFWWLLVRLPGARVPGRVAFRGVLLAAVGFELLKILGTYTIAKSAGSPTAGPFAGILAVLIWIQLVCRFLLFCAARIAAVTADGAVAPVEPVAEVVAPVAVVEVAPRPAVGAVFGAGAVTGAVVALIVARRERADSDGG